MTNEIMATVPISDRVPLAQWIQEYHAFRTRFELELYRTGLSSRELHRKRLGHEAASGVWTGVGYAVVVATRTVTFEVSEMMSTNEALAAFHAYQDRLFRPNSS